jgi:hypothetical protein
MDEAQEGFPWGMEADDGEMYSNLAGVEQKRQDPALA